MLASHFSETASCEGLTQPVEVHKKFEHGYAWLTPKAPEVADSSADGSKGKYIETLGPQTLGFLPGLPGGDDRPQVPL